MNHIRDQFDNELMNWDHIRRLGEEGNYRQAVYDRIQQHNWEELDDGQSWRVVDEVM